MNEEYIPQEVLDEIDNLSYDVLMSLRTGMPVSIINEYKLCDLIEGGNLALMTRCPNLRELTEYFLDNGIDGAWNIGNMLIG